jgi:type I restriction enzyme R subunit
MAGLTLNKDLGLAMAKNFISEDDIEQALIQKLQHLYGFDALDCFTAKADDLNDGSGRKDKRDVILQEYLLNAIESLNDEVPNGVVEKVIEQVMNLRLSISPAKANKELDGFIRDGVPVEFEDKQGEKHNIKIKLINFDEPKKNTYLAVTQLWIKSTGQNAFAGYRRPDVILYVNGLPLIFIELKNSNVKLKSAFDDNLFNYKNDIPQLFHCNVFCILSNAIETKVGSFTAKWEHFFNWLRIDDEKEKIDRKTISEQGTSLEFAIGGLCQQDKLLDYIENFVMFKGETNKIIAQNHQFIGVNKAFDNFLNRGTLSGQLGVFWHTQGSGKSFSMIFFARKVFRKVNGNFSFVIVTDRVDLDRQIYSNFVSTATISESQAAQPKNSTKMREFLSSNKKVVFTPIQKFRWPKGKKYPNLLTDPNREVIVMVDEAHRTQYKSLAENMREGLKGAHYMAFTGTPLLGKDRKTNKWFGDYVSEYNFQQAMDDKATVPLFYEKRVPTVANQNDELGEEFYELLENEELDEAQRQKLEDKYSRQIEVIKRDDRLEIVAKDIAYHFPRRGYLGKAMVVSLDKFTAVRMYDKVQHEWKQEKKRLRGVIKSTSNEIEKQHSKQLIKYMDSVDMAVVVSTDGKDEERFKKQKLDIKPHAERMSSLDEHKCDIEENFKDPEHPLQIVFVCAMWLTGFDAPTVSTLYIDKPMKDHTLMQTIARANRVSGYHILGLNGQLVEKNNGEIVDYFNVFRNMKKALKDYALGDEGGEDSKDNDEQPVQEKNELFKLLDDAIEQTVIFCQERKVYLDKIIEQDEIFKNVALFEEYADILFSCDEWRKSFNVYDNTVSSLYEACKPEIFKQPPRLLFPVIQYLRGIIDAHLEHVDIEEVCQRINQLLDESIIVKNTDKFSIKEHKAEYKIVQKGKQWDLSKIDFDKLREDFITVQYKNIEIAEMRSFIENKLRTMLTQNSNRTDFGQRFHDIIERYNSGSSSVENTYEEMLKYTEDMSEEDERHVRLGLTEDELEIFDSLKKDKLNEVEEQKVKLAAQHLIKRLKEESPKVLVQDWWKDSQTRKRVESTVEEVLDNDLPESYDRKEFKEKSDKVFNMILGFAKQHIKWVA